MIQSNCILTERLILRRFVDEDAEDLFALMSDDYICRMAGIPPFKTFADVERFIDNWYYDAYAITERGSDKVIGVIETIPFLWDRRASIGYWLADKFRGRGYMTEAVKAVKEILFGYWWCDELLIQVFVGNEASRRVALKCGFYPVYDAYKENVYSPYGRIESEECFTMTRDDYEWEQSGATFYTTASPAEVA